MSLYTDSKRMPDVPLHAASVFVVCSARDKARPHSYGMSSGSSASSFLSLELERQQIASAGNYKVVHESRSLNGSLWEHINDEGFCASEDLSPAVLRALGGTPHGEAVSERIPGIRLSAKGMRLVNGGYAMPSGNPTGWAAEDQLRYRPALSGLCIKLTNAARKRLIGTGALNDTNELFVNIEQVFAIFPSQYCILVAELKITTRGTVTLSPFVIEEALHILSKRGQVCEFCSMINGPPVDLHDLLKSTVPAQRFEMEDRLRIFHYAVVVIGAFPYDLSPVKELAFRCARHYTLDYDIAEGEVTNSFYSPFKSVIHAFGIEGAASIVDGSDEFLREQFLTRVRQVYLWLVALAYHEQSYLLGLVHRENFVLGSIDKRTGRLRALLDDFLEFRLRHRMPVVSHIEMHNQVYQALRQHLRLDELINKVTQDVVEAERWLTQQIEHRRADESRRREIELGRRKIWRRKFNALEAFVSGFLMFGLTYLSFDALTHKVAMLKWKSDLPEPWNFLVPLAIASVAAALRAWQVRSEIYEDPLFELEQEMTATGEASDLARIVGL